MSTPIPSTYERISGDRIEKGQHIRWNGEWYLILSVGEPINHHGHSTRTVIARNESTELKKEITLYSSRFYSHEKAKVSQ